MKASENREQNKTLSYSVVPILFANHCMLIHIYNNIRVYSGKSVDVKTIAEHASL